MSQEDDIAAEEVNPASVDVARLIEEVSNPVIGFLASSGAFLVGAGLLADDAADFGKLGVERDPPLPHHWLYGGLIMMGGIVGMGFNLLRLVQENPPPPRIPRSLVEGMSREELDRFR